MSANKQSIFSRSSTFILEESDPIRKSSSFMKGKMSTVRSHKSLLKEEKEFEEALSTDQIVRKILLKRPGLRTEGDIDFLAKATEAIDFIKNLANEMGVSTVRGVCRNLKLETFKVNQEIFHKGSIGDKYYIMLRGTAGVYLYMPKDQTEQGKKHFVLTEVNTIRQGVGFGELALINDQPRTASIICKEDCEVAVLNKDKYKELLIENEKKKFTEQFNFIASIPIFTKIDRRELLSLIVQFKKQQFPMNHMVYKEGDNPDRFYLIYAGFFKV